MHTASFILIIALLCTPAAIAQTRPSAATSRPSTEVLQLVSQLQAEQWATRQQAQDRLSILGDEARPLLLSVVKAPPDEEVRARAEAALRQIETNRIAGTTFITLNDKDGNPREIYRSLAEQAGAEFRPIPESLWSEPLPTISISAHRKPFWEVMRELVDKTSVAPSCGYNGSSDRRMTLSRSGAQWAAVPFVISGPFMVTATQIHRSNTVNLATPNGDNDEFSIQFMVYGEPKLRVVQYASTVRLEQAVDENGNSLLPRDPSEPSFSTGGTWSWNLSGKLRYPSTNPGKRIALLKGVAQFILQTRAKTIQIDDILNTQEITRTIEGKEYTLKRAQKQGEQYAVTVVFHRNGRSDSEWSYFQSNVYQCSGLRLVDGHGRSLDFAGSGASSSSNDAIEVTYQFVRGDDDETEPGEPTRLLWEVPIETHLRNVSFEFRDLPLP